MVTSYPQRRSLRLRGYDYSQAGAYFFMVCTDQRICLFGHVDNNGAVQLNAAGTMPQDVWERLPSRLRDLELDAFAAMPNHVHGIIVLTPEGIGQATLGDVLRVFKSVTTHAYVIGVRDRRWQRYARRLWQRNYYEHVIRNDDVLDRARTYIAFNAIRWADDTDNPRMNAKGR